MGKSLRIGVIGGGPAGIALAHRLAGAGHSVSIFEAGDSWGGLARSFDLGGLRIERYYHFLCGDDTGYLKKLRELGMENQVCWTATKMGFFYRGRTYPFSGALDLLRCGALSAAGRVRYALSILYCRAINNWRRLDAISAEQWLRKLVGKATYEATWYPLLQVKFHQYHDQVSAAWIWHRIHRVAKSRKRPLHREKLGYLSGGTEALLGRMIADLEAHGAQLHLKQPVSAVRPQPDGSVTICTPDGRSERFDRAAAAIPLPALLRLVPELPEEYSSRIKSINYLGIVCVVLRLKRSMSPYFWLNINDPRVHFNGCIEFSNLNPALCRDGSSVLYIPYYLPASHPRFCMTDEEILAECMAALRIVNPEFREDWVLDSAVSRDASAQVVCSTGFLKVVPSFETPVRNLYLIESSQLYPADRNISHMIDLAEALVRRMNVGVV